MVWKVETEVTFVRVVVRVLSSLKYRVIGKEPKLSISISYMLAYIVMSTTGLRVLQHFLLLQTCRVAPDSRMKHPCNGSVEAPLSIV